MRTLLLPALLLSVLASGCDNGCPSVTRLDALAGPPSMVQVTFQVKCEGEPVAAVTASDLSLTEDGQPVIDTSAFTVQKLSQVLPSQTLILLDISSALVADGQVEATRTALVGLVETLQAQGQRVGLAIFDGDPDLRVVREWTGDLDLFTQALQEVDTGDRLDSARDLNGTLLQALALLDEAVGEDGDDTLAGIANLVVVVDGPDTARRESDSAAERAVDDSVHEVFVLAQVSEAVASSLEPLAKTGFFHGEGAEGLAQAAADASDGVVAQLGKFYRLSYCSPLRSPKATLKIEVAWEDGSDSISFDYPTADFGPGCSLPQ